MKNKFRPISPEQLAELAHMGRGGDTMLAHINEQEAAMLKRMGGSGTINPHTGLPEFAMAGTGLSWGVQDIDGGYDWYDAGGGMYGDLGSGFNNVNDPFGTNDGSVYTGGGGAAVTGTNPDSGAVQLDFTGMAPGVPDTTSGPAVDFGPAPVYPAPIDLGPEPTPIPEPTPWEPLPVEPGPLPDWYVNPTPPVDTTPVPVYTPPVDTTPVPVYTPPVVPVTPVDTTPVPVYTPPVDITPEPVYTPPVYTPPVDTTPVPVYTPPVDTTPAPATIPGWMPAGTRIETVNGITGYNIDGMLYDQTGSIIGVGSNPNAPVAPPIDQIPDLGEIVIPDQRPPETPYVYPPDLIIPPGDILEPVPPYVPPIDQIPDLGEIVIPDKRPVTPPPEPPPVIPLVPPGDILEPVPPVEPEIPELVIDDKRPPKPPVIDVTPVPPVVEPPELPPIVEPPPPPPPPVVEPPEPPPEPPVVPPVPPVVEPPPPPPPPIVEPPPPEPPVLPPVVPPVPPVVEPPVPPVVPPTPPVTTSGRMLNPGWIQPTPFYKTTNAAQSKFFWGGHGPQFESGNPAQPFNARAYNQVAAPNTPWGIQQVAAPLSPADYQAIIAGTYRAPAPAVAATRMEAYQAPTQTAPVYGQYQVPVLPTTTATTTTGSTRELYTADQKTAISQALGSDWQKRLDNAALNGDYATIVEIQNQINSVLNPTREQP